MAIQYEQSSHSQLYADCPLDRLTFPITRADCLVSDRDGTMPPLLVVRAMAPFVSQAKWPPWQGVWAAATINTAGMRSLGWRRLLLHANPSGHCIPAYLPKGCTLH